MFEETDQSLRLRAMELAVSTLAALVQTDASLVRTMVLDDNFSIVTQAQEILNFLKGVPQ